MRHKNVTVVSFFIAMLSVMAAMADEYDSYVWLNGKDDASGKKSSFFDNTEGYWQKKNAEGVFEVVGEGPHAGEKYYVPANCLLVASNMVVSEGCPVEHVFAGDELVVKNRFYMGLKRSDSSSDDANVRVDNLVLLPGGHFYNANPAPASVSGTCTVKGTSRSPSYWYNYAKNGRPIFKSTLLGEKDSVFWFRNQDPKSDGAPTVFLYTGDASGFYGTMRLIGPCSRLSVATPGGFVFPGTVEISDGSVFEVSAGATATVCNIDSNGGAISISADETDTGFAQLTVTNAVETNGKPIPISYGPTLSEKAETRDILRFSPDAPGVLSVSDYNLSSLHFAQKGLNASPAAYLPNVSLSVRTDGDGSRTLSLSHGKYVYLKVSGGENASALLPANKSQWSDGNEISPENDYYIGAVSVGLFCPIGEVSFAGASLTVCSSSVLYFNKSTKLTVPDFRWVAHRDVGTRIQIWNASPVVSGMITLPKVDGAVFRTEMWNGGAANHCFTLASELAGDGTLELSSLSTASNDSRAFYAITGLNAGFAGRIRLTRNAFGGKNKATYEADPDKYCVTLTVSDSRNLGGAMAAFDAESLFIARHSLLKVTDSTVFSEPTRGWSVEGVGRISVASGKTVAVTGSRITYSGEFRKEGDGMLKLGGTARFTAEGSETPVEGTNVLSIAAGALMPASATAFDGLEVRFAAGTKLVLDASAEGDLAKYGMYNVKWDTPVSVADGAALPVEFAVAEGFDAESVGRFGIVTVNPTAAADMDADDFAVKAPKGMKAVVSSKENLDGDGNVSSVTFFCDLLPCGFAITVR